MVCTNPNCRKDCPYAEAPNPRTFKCFECKLISDMMGNKPTPGKPRTVKIGDKVRRHKANGEIELHTVQEVWNHEFSVERYGLSPSYNQHCVKGRFPYWEHEDGSPIIPPPKS